jgi:type IV secretory pathway VirB4 component
VQPNQQPIIQTGPASVPAAAPIVQTPPPPNIPRNPNSTQNTLQFEELRDNLVIMGDGSFRGIVAAQSINFDLMSEREREGIEQSYADFLNSLTFPVQIYIRSQRVDIGPYLTKLQKLRDAEDNMLLGVLMDDYLQFIEALSQEANIMDKSFFVVIPYAIGDESKKLGADSKLKITELFTNKNAKVHVKVSANKYDQVKDEMTNRVNLVIEGLTQIGIRATRLKTKELGQLYYNIYNPDTALRQPIGDFRDYRGIVTKKGEGLAPVINAGEYNG